MALNLISVFSLDSRPSCKEGARSQPRTRLCTRRLARSRTSRPDQPSRRNRQAIITEQQARKHIQKVRRADGPQVSWLAHPQRLPYACGQASFSLLADPRNSCAEHKARRSYNADGIQRITRAKLARACTKLIRWNHNTTERHCSLTLYAFP